ncbi:MAG: homocysteine S-methyltransferase family protein, partial [Thermoguttaceae bacterium]|nr:homocysteine S-methyltransferase family protein [Thermoguttaceae bacterium]
MANSIFADWLTGGALLLDGAWGTEFQKRGLPSGAAPDLWNIENPDAVFAVAKSYVDAGSDVILTNSFGSTRFVLANNGAQDKVAELNRRAGEISKKAAATAVGRVVRVLGSVGPTGVMLALGQTPESEIYDAYFEQIEALKAGG